MGHPKSVLAYTARGALAKHIDKVVALAPPRLAHGELKEELGEAFLTEARKAAALVAAGKDEELFEAATPTSALTSARSFHDKYGEDARHDVIGFASSTSTPTLFVLAAADERTVPTARNLTRDLRRVAAGMGGIVAVESIAGANSFFSKLREQAVVAVERWTMQIAESHESQQAPSTDSDDSAA